MVAFTEVLLGTLPSNGGRCDAGTDWGYTLPHPDRRKVARWSKKPWRDIDPIGDSALPAGRFVAATTESPIGSLRVVGVCIPWDGAHVSSGRKDRARNEDHIAYLDGLGGVLARQPRPLVVIGDFNQRIPRQRQSKKAYEALEAALRDLVVLTAGDTAVGPLIDHIAIDPSLQPGEITLLNRDQGDLTLSDHHGVIADLTAQES